MWLATLGKERIGEVPDIEIALTNWSEIVTKEPAKEHKPYGLQQRKLLNWVVILQK